ncbi:hypothetical protein [Brevundimonas diminuta]|uniref:hypothetical protein n=1 Tax=Brevundimonas diminuta TaxID=293 RepID=UPI0020931F90|nr:hypothetical protein [Brevundimonas diminuta]
MQIGDASVAGTFDTFTHLRLDSLVRRVEQYGGVSRIKLQDHRAITIAPTIPITGSSQTQPRYRPAISATMARTEVRGQPGRENRPSADCCREARHDAVIVMVMVVMAVMLWLWPW